MLIRMASMDENNQQPTEPVHTPIDPDSQVVETALPMKLLIVEDDQFINDIISANLTQRGFKIISANNGNAVVGSAEREMPDLILLDLMLPGIGGEEVLGLLKKHEELKRIPVIVFSNISEKLHIDKVMQLGAVDYLVKASTPLAKLVDVLIKYSNQPASAK